MITITLDFAAGKNKSQIGLVVTILVLIDTVGQLNPIF